MANVFSLSFTILLLYLQIHPRCQREMVCQIRYILERN